MNKWILLFLLSPILAWGAMAPPPPATQAEVDAGLLHNKFVAPDTLKNWSGAGSPTGGVTAAQATNISRYFTTNYGSITNIGTALLSASNYAARVVLLNTNDNLKTILEASPNDTAYVLSPGNYTVTPSMLNSNLITGNTFTGITLANKTNVYISGIPGLSILNGSSSVGEILWITNCNNMRFEGLTVIGYTNHNFMVLPTVNAGLWALVNYYQCGRLEFVNCIIQRSADHGLQDKGAEISGFTASSVLSTNVLIAFCKFSDIGGWRTNSSAGGSITYDGTCIVPSAAEIRNCLFESSLRGVEPYNESEASGYVFKGTRIADSIFRNIADAAIITSGSTNGHNIEISGNQFYYTETSYHGSNLTTTASLLRGTSIELTGGRRHVVRGNFFESARAKHVLISLGSVDDSVFENNYLQNTALGLTVGNENSTVSPINRFRSANNTFKDFTSAAIYLIGVRDFVSIGDKITGTNAVGGQAVLIHASGNNRNTNVTFINTEISDPIGLSAYGVSITANSVGVTFVNPMITAGTSGRINNNAGTEFQEFNTIAGDLSKLIRQSDLNSVSNYLQSISGGGSGGTNFPAVLSSFTNTTVGTGVRKSQAMSVTSSNQFQNFQGTALNGEDVITRWTNSANTNVLITFNVNGSASSFWNYAVKSNDTTFAVPAGSMVKAQWVYSTNNGARWELMNLDGPQLELAPGANTIFTTNGGTLTIASTGSGTPGGTTPMMQMNMGGAFVGTTNYWYDVTNNRVYLMPSANIPQFQVGRINGAAGFTNHLFTSGGNWLFQSMGADPGITLSASPSTTGIGGVGVYTNRFVPALSNHMDNGSIDVPWKNTYSDSIYARSSGSPNGGFAVIPVLRTNYADGNITLPLAVDARANWTNAVAGNRTITITTPVIGNSFNLSFVSDGSARTLSILTGAEVTRTWLSTNDTVNATNILTTASKRSILCGRVDYGSDGFSTNLTLWVKNQTP